MSKISAYGEDTGPTGDDYTITIDTTSGANKKVKLSSLRSIFAGKRVNTVASGTTPTANGDTTDMFTITALAANATIGAPTGTPQDGQVLNIRIKDNGTSWTLAWNAVFRPIGVTLPTATVATKVMYVGCIYNGQDSVWDVVSIGRQA